MDTPLLATWVLVNELEGKGGASAIGELLYYVPVLAKTLKGRHYCCILWMRKPRFLVMQ